MCSRAGEVILGDSSSASHDNDESSTNTSESFTSACDTTPTNSTSESIIPVNVTILSDSDQSKLTRDRIMQKYTNVSEDEPSLDIDNLPPDTNQQKRGRKQSTKGTSKKDKCPCQISDTSSWKPTCNKCNQSWHTACCNLKGIVSITELENWECPWCYIPKFNDPSKPKQISTVLKDMQRDINTVQTCFSNFNAASLRDEISELQNSINELRATSTAPSENNVNKMCNEILKSINFELHKAISDQHSTFVQELSEFKKSLSSQKSEIPSCTNTSSNDHGQRVPVFSGKPYDHHISNFLSEEVKNGLETFVNENDTNFTCLSTRQVTYFGEFSYKYGKTEHEPASMPAVIQKVIDEIHEKFPSDTKLNSCLVTKYENGTSSCPPQVLMVTMSLSSPLTQTFSHFL